MDMADQLVSPHARIDVRELHQNLCSHLNEDMVIADLQALRFEGLPQGKTQGHEGRAVSRMRVGDRWGDMPRLGHVPRDATTQGVHPRGRVVIVLRGALHLDCPIPSDRTQHVVLHDATIAHVDLPHINALVPRDPGGSRTDASWSRSPTLPRDERLDVSPLDSPLWPGSTDEGQVDAMLLRQLPRSRSGLYVSVCSFNWLSFRRGLPSRSFHALRDASPRSPII